MITSQQWHQPTDPPPWDERDSSRSVPVVCYSHGPGYIIGVYHRQNGWTYAHDDQWPIFPSCWHMPMDVPAWAMGEPRWLGV